MAVSTTTTMTTVPISPSLDRQVTVAGLPLPRHTSHHLAGASSGADEVISGVVGEGEVVVPAVADEAVSTSPEMATHCPLKDSSSNTSSLLLQPNGATINLHPKALQRRLCPTLASSSPAGLSRLPQRTPALLVRLFLRRLLDGRTLRANKEPTAEPLSTLLSLLP